MSERQLVMQAIGKILAYKGCGKEEEAKEWFLKLKELLGY